jgi:hypothetical protein
MILINDLPGLAHSSVNVQWGTKKKGQIFTVNGLICCAWASFLSLTHKHTQSPAAAAAAALDQKEN